MMGIAAIGLLTNLMIVTVCAIGFLDRTWERKGSHTGFFAILLFGETCAVCALVWFLVGGKIDG